MIRLAVRAPSEASEQVLAALLELAPGGVEQVDGDGFVEYAVYGAPGELPSLGEGEAEVGGVRVEVSGREVPEDWAERWKRFHAPVLVGGKLYVRPPWEEAPRRRGVIDVVIEPGAAFGTGAHPTTRMCLELMLSLEADGSFYDFGCGSGVLAIAAAKLGFRPVFAFDNDPRSLRVAERNANRNGVRLDRLERVDLRETIPPPGGVLAANLTAPLLRSAAARLADLPAFTIVSGVRDEDVNELTRAFAPLEVATDLRDAGWAALLLRRASGPPAAR